VKIARLRQLVKRFVAINNQFFRFARKHRTSKGFFMPRYWWVNQNQTYKAGAIVESGV